MIRLIISEPSLLLKAKLNQYIDEAIEERNDFNYCVFDFEETPLEEIIDALQMPSFGSDKKVVVCKNPYFIKDEKVKLPFTNDLKQLDEYFKNPNEDSDLIIVCSSKYFTKKSKFINSIAKIGEVENLLFEEVSEFENYGRHLIKQTKINIDSKAETILFERCANDVCKLEREIAKLAIYADKVDVELVKKMVSRPLEDDVFELTNALLKKDRKRIMQIYTDLKLLKMEPIALIAMLANQFRLILQVAILGKENKRNEEIAAILQVHPYRVKLAKDYANNYSLSDVKKIMVDLATLDAKIKTGENDRYVDFELFLATK